MQHTSGQDLNKRYINEEVAVVDLLQIRFAKEIVKYEAILKIISNRIDRIDKYLRKYYYQ